MAYAVDLAALDEAVERLARFEQGLTAALDEVGRRVDGLHMTWSGSAAAEQLAAHRQWAAGAEHMREAVVTVRRAAEAAHANYSGAAQANSGMWA